MSQSRTVERTFRACPEITEGFASSSPVERTFRFALCGTSIFSRGFSPDTCRRLKPARDQKSCRDASLKARSTGRKARGNAALNGGSTLGVLQ